MIKCTLCARYLPWFYISCGNKCSRSTWRHWLVIGTAGKASNGQERRDFVMHCDRYGMWKAGSAWKPTPSTLEVGMKLRSSPIPPCTGQPIWSRSGFFCHCLNSCTLLLEVYSAMELFVTNSFPWPDGLPCSARWITFSFQAIWFDFYSSLESAWMHETEKRLCVKVARRWLFATTCAACVFLLEVWTVIVGPLHNCSSHNLKANV